MRFANFDANLLRTLDVLLVEKSVTRAAERLCVSQPAMSGALQRLRNFFDDQLLIRTGRDMALTPLGESLAAPVRATLLQIQMTLETRPSFDPAVSRRIFNLGISDYGSFVLMPTLLRRLAIEAPFMSCHVVPINIETLGRVEAGDLDLLVNVESCEIVSQRSTARDLKMRGLYSDDFVCMVDEDHGSVGKTLSRGLYQRLPHITVSFGHNLDTLVEKAWKRESLDLNVVATAPSFSSMLFMLPGSQMIATVQRRLANVLAHPLGLKIIECPVNIDPLQQILMWHPRSDLDPGHKFLRQLLADVAGRIERPSRYGAEPVHPTRQREQEHMGTLMQ